MIFSYSSDTVKVIRKLVVKASNFLSDWKNNYINLNKNDFLKCRQMHYLETLHICHVAFWEIHHCCMRQLATILILFICAFLQPSVQVSRDVCSNKNEVSRYSWATSDWLAWKQITHRVSSLCWIQWRWEQSTLKGTNPRMFSNTKSKWTPNQNWHLIKSGLVFPQNYLSFEFRVLQCAKSKSDTKLDMLRKLHVALAMLLVTKCKTLTLIRLW